MFYRNFFMLAITMLMVGGCGVDHQDSSSLVAEEEKSAEEKVNESIEDLKVVQRHFAVLLLLDYSGKKDFLAAEHRTLGYYKLFTTMMAAWNTIDGVKDEEVRADLKKRLLTSLEAFLKVDEFKLLKEILTRPDLKTLRRLQEISAEWAAAVKEKDQRSVHLARAAKLLAELSAEPRTTDEKEIATIKSIAATFTKLNKDLMEYLTRDQ